MLAKRAWIPILHGSTGDATGYDAQEGSYHVIGNTLFFDCYINLNALTGLSGSVTITNTVNWQASHAYVVGTFVLNGGRRYRCLTAGTSAASGGPTGTATSGIADGTVVWGNVALDPAANADTVVACACVPLDIVPTAAGTIVAQVAAGANSISLFQYNSTTGAISALTQANFRATSSIAVSGSYKINMLDPAVWPV
jgi:hypothetical protein